jgi:hypothetical protein
MVIKRAAGDSRKFGTLKERMNFVMECMHEAGYQNIPNTLWHAVYDLETLVGQMPDDFPVDKSTGRKVSVAEYFQKREMKSER